MKYSYHATQRMHERGITDEDITTVIEKGRRVQKLYHGIPSIEYRYEKSVIICDYYTNTVITCYIDRQSPPKTKNRRISKRDKFNKKRRK